MDDETKELMKNFDLGKDEAEEVRELADELGVDPDEAFEIWEAQ